MRSFTEYLAAKINEARGITEEPLKEDLETIKKHINNVIFKPYKIKIENFFLHGDYGDSQVFKSNSMSGASLGVFGPAIEYVQVHLSVSDFPGKSNSKNIELLIRYTTKQDINNSFQAGSYILQDGSIRYISAEENKPIEEVGESKFAIVSHEEI